MLTAKVIVVALFGQFVVGAVPPARPSASAAATAAKAPARPETLSARKARLKAEGQTARAAELSRRRRVAREKAAREQARAAREDANRDFADRADAESGGPAIRARALQQRERVRRRSGQYDVPAGMTIRPAPSWR